MDCIVHFIKQRRYLGLLLVLAVSGCAMEVSDESSENRDFGGGTDQTQAWWRGLTQVERNRLILFRAAEDIDRPVGKNCKEWARQAVYDASRGVVSVPPTVNGGYGWYWESGSRHAIGMRTNIRNVRPGWIVQMRIPDGQGGITPHTAIVYALQGDGLWWIESNYFSRTDPNAVHLRFQSFADFERQVSRNGTQEFSVYYVGGG